MCFDRSCCGLRAKRGVLNLFIAAACVFFFFLLRLLPLVVFYSEPEGLGYVKPQGLGGPGCVRDAGTSRASLLAPGFLGTSSSLEPKAWLQPTER